MSNLKTADQPTQEIVFIDSNNVTHQITAKVIPASGYKAYMLVDINGKQASKTFEVFKDKVKHFVIFDGLWIENGEVYSLNLVTKDKAIYMGKHVRS